MTIIKILLKGRGWQGAVGSAGPAQNMLELMPVIIVDPPRSVTRQLKGWKAGKISAFRRRPALWGQLKALKDEAGGDDTGDQAKGAKSTG